MRWALIESGHVANVVEQDDEPQISGQWVACGDACPGWTYDGSDFAPPPAPPSPPVVPVITRRQGRLALHNAGRLVELESGLEDLPEPQRSVVLIEYKDATEWRRDWPTLSYGQQILGWTDAEVDAFFAVASAL